MAMKKQIEQLEKKVEELEKTIGYQQDMINAINNTLTNQRFLFEMLMTKVNQPSVPSADHTIQQNTSAPEQTLAPLQKQPVQAPNPFPLIRRTMV